MDARDDTRSARAALFCAQRVLISDAVNREQESRPCEITARTKDMYMKRLYICHVTEARTDSVSP